MAKLIMAKLIKAMLIKAKPLKAKLGFLIDTQTEVPMSKPELFTLFIPFKLSCFRRF
jgi:hypothetical protein